MKLSKGFFFVLFSTFFLIIVTATESRAVTAHLIVVPFGGDPLKPPTFTGLVEPAPPDPTQYVRGTLAPSILLWSNETPNIINLNRGASTVINLPTKGWINIATESNGISIPDERLAWASRLAASGGHPVDWIPSSEQAGTTPTQDSVTLTVNVATLPADQQAAFIARLRAGGTSGGQQAAAYDSANMMGAGLYTRESWPIENKKNKSGSLCTGTGTCTNANLNCDVSGCTVTTSRDICGSGNCTTAQYCTGNSCETMAVNQRSCTSSGACTYQATRAGIVTVLTQQGTPMFNTPIFGSFIEPDYVPGTQAYKARIEREQAQRSGSFCTETTCTGANLECSGSVCTITTPSDICGNCTTAQYCTGNSCETMAVNQKSCTDRACSYQATRTGNITVSGSASPQASGNYLINPNTFRTRDTLRQDVIDDRQLLKLLRQPAPGTVNIIVNIDPGTFIWSGSGQGPTELVRQLGINAYQVIDELGIVFVPFDPKTIQDIANEKNINIVKEKNFGVGGAFP